MDIFRDIIHCLKGAILQNTLILSIGKSLLSIKIVEDLNFLEDLEDLDCFCLKEHGRKKTGYLLVHAIEAERKKKKNKRLHNNEWGFITQPAIFNSLIQQMLDSPILNLYLCIQTQHKIQYL